MQYIKKPDDNRYRLVNLRRWNRSVCMEEFPKNNRIYDDNLYEVLEVEHLDGSTEIISYGEEKEYAYCVVGNGKIEVTFDGPRMEKEGRPCVGHLFAVYKNRRGIRYHFPRTEGESGGKSSKKVSYKALIGRNIEGSDVQMTCDEYFASALKLEQD